MMSKHTPEPWVATGRAIKRDNGFSYGEIIANVLGGKTSGPFFVQSYDECEANAIRIVGCVNACAGMEDPAAEIDELKRQRDELFSVISAILEEVPHRHWSRGNAPGHCHDVAGIWGDDNGDLAGKECGWCKAWRCAVDIYNKTKGGEK